MAPYEMLYGKKCRSPLHWDEVGEERYLDPYLVKEATEAVEKIQNRMVTAQSRQKSYADAKRRIVEFVVGDKVFLRVSPMKGVMHFGKRGKQSPRFIGLFEILDRVEQVAYRLALPVLLAETHNVFHVSMLRKHVSDPSHMLTYERMELKQDLSYEVRPVHIIERETKELKSKSILLVKVLWSKCLEREATWEWRKT
ncbi:uncharacterized protein LOC133036115 [Cannabis sativa]|uniref:uncharacterized protein LOC133036115 n=1 Tax=Cannabis sativa TaxID=3483 RepID=UPI0029CA3E08|nr:uncharacterized protein LOC133036115 [Cannabis sativa]